MELAVSRDGYPILDQFSEEGFVDCVLQIVERVDHDDHHELVLRASYKDKPVGMKVLVRRNIQGGFDAEMELIAEHVYRSGVRFLRTGPESDDLVGAIATLYGLPAASRRMVEDIAFTGIALHRSGEVDMEVQPIKIKLFGYDGPEDFGDQYFESFFNLDLGNGFVFWNEKDEEYREALVRGLSVPAGD